MKGAAEVILNRCRFYLNENGEKLILDESTQNLFSQHQRKLAEEGERILGVCEKYLDVNVMDIPTDLAADDLGTLPLEVSQNHSRSRLIACD
jgi:magnesium-transporting ATPase (P-type)